MTDRFIAPVSTGELERRWAVAREIMARSDLDALVLQNSNDWLGGYVRWLTGVPAKDGYPRAVVFPREGKMTVVEQGSFGGRKAPDADDLLYRGVGELLTAPTYVSAGYSPQYDADLVAGALASMKARRVGWVSPAAAYHGFGKALEAATRNLTFIDVTDAIDLAKAVKSEEEQAFTRLAAELQDKVVADVAGFLKPGMHDFEVIAFAQYRASLYGAEQGIYMGTSSPAGKAALFRPRHLQGRKIEAGDVMALLVETNGPGGYYTEIGRTLVLGKANQTLRQSLKHAVDAQAATLRQLTPGTPCAEVFATHNRYMQAQGLPQESRLYSHGQGYDLVERPLIRQDESMSIAQGMSIVVHPGYINDEVFALICDNYLIGADGPGECIHHTPKEIIEL